MLVAAEGKGALMTPLKAVFRSGRSESISCSRKRRDSPLAGKPPLQSVQSEDFTKPDAFSVCHDVDCKNIDLTMVSLQTWRWYQCSL